MAGCASIAPDAAPGLNSREQEELARSYYWTFGSEVSEYSDEDLVALMEGALRPGMDGAVSEGYMSSLMVALAAVGDLRFAQILAQRSPLVQRKVARYVESAWSFSGLTYPHTRELCERVLRE